RLAPGDHRAGGRDDVGAADPAVRGAVQGRRLGPRGGTRAMTVPLVDLRGLIRSLHTHRVNYLVAGAIAMVFYGYVRNTEDLDLVVDPDPENLDRVADWLASLGAMLRLNPMSQFGERERAGL